VSKIEAFHLLKETIAAAKFQGIQGSSQEIAAPFSPGIFNICSQFMSRRGVLFPRDD
jgi:hypothetical protein